MKNLKKHLGRPLFLIVIFGFTINAYSQTTDESKATDLPLPSALYVKHIEAIGGEEAIMASTERSLTGRFLIEAYGIDGSLHIIAKAPNKMVTTIDLGAFGINRSGFNGSIAWSMDPESGNRILSGEALQAMDEKSNFYADNLQLGKDATKQKTVDVVTFNGFEQYRVFLLNKNGEESYLYFSKKTGLLSGVDRIELSAMGKVPTQIRFSNYVQLDGLKTVRRIAISQNGVESTIVINSVSYDDHATNAFDLPSEIKAILND